MNMLDNLSACVYLHAPPIGKKMNCFYFGMKMRRTGAQGLTKWVRVRDMTTPSNLSHLHPNTIKNKKCERFLQGEF